MRLPFCYSLLTTLLCVGFVNPVSAQAKQLVPKADVNSAVKTPVDVAGIEFFEKKVRPVLIQQCYGCHSVAAKKTMGKLALDSRSALLMGGQTGPVVVPGHPESSRLLEAVRYTRPDLQMPPNSKLPDAVIADLTEWIKMGAPWPGEEEGETIQGKGKREKGKEGAPSSLPASLNPQRFWAFQPVRKVVPPAVKAKSGVLNPIDRFIQAKLEAKGLKPAPPADRRTLIRRAYFDLIGLPPTPDEVNAFLADKSPDAWAALINRLLESPHYGERWGRYWLDIARYGEDQAHSFEPRLYPQGFRYRDWLARALNSDMPYDRFIKEQIAADLLNEPNLREQLPALGFFALGPVYYGDEKMYDQYDDRIDTLSRGFLGLTVACARCHDHKFDPISQKDYYALAGVFASTGYIEVPLGSADAKANFGKAEAAVNRHTRIDAQNQQIDKFLDAQETASRSRLLSQTARYMVGAWKLHNRRKTNPKVSVEQVAKEENLYGVVLERWDKYLKDSQTGHDKDRPQLADWKRMVQQEDAKTDLSTNEAGLAGAQKAAVAFQEVVLALSRRREALAAPQTPAKSGSVGQDKPQPLDKAETETLNALVGNEGVLAVPRDQIEKVLPEADKTRLAALKADLERLKAEPFIHALTEGTKIANVPVLLRGNPNTPGEEAPRHFLTVLAGGSAPPFQQGSGRLELANAIADKNNPLTARVMVNRIWQHHFGTGLVRTASNFGLLGEPPSHPELLDWLASHFVANDERGMMSDERNSNSSLITHHSSFACNWSLKKLHRMIMLSAAYKRSGAGNLRDEEVDPDNRLLWRMPARRLEVEAWRDAMLAVSDKLDRTVGGPSVPLSSPDNFRRTFYASVSRHDLDSMLRLFDYPDPNVTSDARTTTTVPLQQLFVLNSEFMIRQAKAFAARLTANAGESDADRIRKAFLLAYNRLPSDRELLLGLTFLQQKPSADSAGNASLTLAGNKAPMPTVTTLSRWEQYAQVLLSANEFMVID